jgi:hypothetical protein
MREPAHGGELLVDRVRTGKMSVVGTFRLLAMFTRPLLWLAPQFPARARPLNFQRVLGPLLPQ